jgi:hypothetical protein
MFSDKQRAQLAALAHPCDVDRLVQAVEACGFDAAAYLAANPDVKADPGTATWHFLAHGYCESRHAPGGELFQGLTELLACPVDNRDYLKQLCSALYLAQLRQQKNLKELWSLADPAVIDRIRALGGAPYFIVGDSHSQLYARGNVISDGTWLAPLHLFCPGGSAIGLVNDNSRSLYRKRLLRWAHSAAPIIAGGVPVFLKFGQVDAEFVWAYRRIRDRERAFSMSGYKAFVLESVDAYGRFLRRLRQRIDPAQLRICSIFPPVLSDEAWAKGYVNAHIGRLEGDRDLEALSKSVRELEIPGLATRTLMHDLYNGQLKQLCASHGLRYVDDFEPFLGLSGLVDPSYIPYGKGQDHHVDHVPAGPVITQILERELKPLSHPRPVGE